jgi:hypothetical protein
MLGSLIVSFCERDSVLVTEIWAFPDSTLNVVVSGDREHSLPCSPFQLAHVLDEKPMTLRSEDTTIHVKKVDRRVCVEVESGDASWTQCIAEDDFREAMETVEAKLSAA